MRMQQIKPPRINQVGARGVAMQHGFPEAAIQNREIGCNPNRPFAAHVSDVSVAD